MSRSLSLVAATAMIFAFLVYCYAAAKHDLFGRRDAPSFLNRGDFNQKE